MGRPHRSAPIIQPFLVRPSIHPSTHPTPPLRPFATAHRAGWGWLTGCVTALRDFSVPRAAVWRPGGQRDACMDGWETVRPNDVAEYHTTTSAPRAADCGPGRVVRLGWGGCGCVLDGRYCTAVTAVTTVGTGAAAPCLCALCYGTDLGTPSGLQAALPFAFFASGTARMTAEAKHRRGPHAGRSQPRPLERMLASRRAQTLAPGLGEDTDRAGLRSAPRSGLTADGRGQIVAAPPSRVAAARLRRRLGAEEPSTGVGGSTVRPEAGRSVEKAHRVLRPVSKSPISRSASLRAAGGEYSSSSSGPRTRTTRTPDAGRHDGPAPVS
jgi:hypothetical protein